MTSQQPATQQDLPAAWPAITYEDIEWGRPPLVGGSRRQQALARSGYRAAMPATIARRDLSLPALTAALVEEAAAEIARFDVEMGRDAAPFAALLLRSESASSSQIENLTAGARDIALAELGMHGGNAELIASNVTAMRAAIELADSLDADNILAMHFALMAEQGHADPGQWRSEQVWIGGGSIPHMAEFVPPYHDRVPAAIADLVQFMARDDLPVLAQVAIAHAQFETIHPFADGNGRTGRALVASILRNKRLSRHVTIPVSSGLLTDTRAYFDTLGEYRRGDPLPVIEIFAESSLRSVANGRGLVADIQAAQRRWAEADPAPAGSAISALREYLARQPVVTAELVAEALGVSTATSYRAIDRAVASGVLVASNAGTGRGIWHAAEILAALDEFAARAGRRSWSRD